MSPTLTTFLFELTNFLLLAGLLGWLLFKPVRTVLQARQATEKRQADELAARAAEADRLRADLEQRLSAFEQEMARLRKEHLAAADQEAAATLAKARESAEQERGSVKRMLAHLERAQVERLSTAVAAATRQSVAGLLTVLNGPDLEAALVQAACRQLSALDGRWLGAALIESALPLGADMETAVRTAIGGRATAAEFRVVPDLGAGLRITTARGLIDASAAGIAGQAERMLIDALGSESFEAATP